MRMGLLSAVAQWNKLLDGVVVFFKEFQIIYCVEILLFFALIFFVSKVLRENDATKLMVLYWVLLIIGGCVHIFDENLMKGNVFLFYVLLISAFMLILFNVEVKKSLWDVHKASEGAEKTQG